MEINLSQIPIFILYSLRCTDKHCVIVIVQQHVSNKWNVICFERSNHVYTKNLYYICISPLSSVKVAIKRNTQKWNNENYWQSFLITGSSQGMKAESYWKNGQFESGMYALHHLCTVEFFYNSWRWLALIFGIPKLYVDK